MHAQLSRLSIVELDTKQLKSVQYIYIIYTCICRNKLKSA